MQSLKSVDILITGGDGFIGSHLTEELITEGARLTLLVKPKSNLWRIKEVISKVNIVEADISDYNSLLKALSGVRPQKIFHLAAIVDTEQRFDKSEALLKVNTLGTINLLRALEKINYDCFIYTSSCEEYGNSPFPFKENQLISPLSPYSASKTAGALFCKVAYEIENKPVIILRLSPGYGPKQEFNSFIPQVIQAAIKGENFKMTKGEQYREFIYVSDIVSAFIKAAKEPRAIGEIINIGTGYEYQLKTIADRIVNFMGSQIKILSGAIPYRKKEIWHLCCDNTKAKNLLDWKPETDLDSGLQNTIKWYKNNINNFSKK